MKAIAFLATAAISISAQAMSFGSFLGTYSVDNSVCYTDGEPTRENCSADLVQLENSDRKICVKVNSPNSALSQTICMSEYRSDNRADHTPHHFYEAHFNSNENTASWVKSLRAGSYRSSQVVSLTAQGANLILNISTTVVSGGQGQSKSVFHWLKPRVRILPIEIPPASAP